MCSIYSAPTYTLVVRYDPIPGACVKYVNPVSCRIHHPLDVNRQGNGWDLASRPASLSRVAVRPIKERQYVVVYVPTAGDLAIKRK